MAYEDGVGFKRVRTITAGTDKDYIKIKQVSDLTRKNYATVKEVETTDSKNYINVVPVSYDSPKDYLRVNFVDESDVTRWFDNDGWIDSDPWVDGDSSPFYQLLTAGSYGIFDDKVKLASAYTIEYDVYIAQIAESNRRHFGGVNTTEDGTKVAGSTYNDWFSFYATASGELRVQYPKTTGYMYYLTIGTLQLGKNHVRAAFDGVSTFSGEVNGVAFTFELSIPRAQVNIEAISSARNGYRAEHCAVYNLSITGVTKDTAHPTGTVSFKLDECVDCLGRFKDSDNGCEGTWMHSEPYYYVSKLTFIK